MGRRKKLKKGSYDSREHHYVEQPCSLCGYVEDTDSVVVSHICALCAIQIASGAGQAWIISGDYGECTKCGESTTQVCRTFSGDRSSITEKHICLECHPIQYEEKITIVEKKRPQGWQFKNEFVDDDGTVFHRGVEVPALKGTLPPTDVETMRKEQKERKKEKKAHKAEREEKRQQKLATEYEKKKKKLKQLEQEKAEELQTIING